MPNRTPDTPVHPGALAEKLRVAMSMKLHPDGTPYTQQEVADEVSRMYREDRLARARIEGATPAEIQAIEEEKALFNRQYLSALLNGRSDNPTRIMIKYLARFFHLTPGDLFEEESGTPGASTAEAQERQELLQAVQELKSTGKLSELLALGRSAQELSPAAATAMLKMALLNAQSFKELESSQGQGQL